MLASGMNFGSSIHAMFHANRTIDFARASSKHEACKMEFISQASVEVSQSREGQHCRRDRATFTATPLKKLSVHRFSQDYIHSVWQAKEALRCKYGSCTWQSDDGTLPVCNVYMKRQDSPSVQRH